VRSADRTEASTPDPSIKSPGVRARWRDLIVFVLSLLLILAVLSYSPADSVYLSGGVSGPQSPHNLIGYVGAYVAYALFLTFGLASYVLAGLVFLGAVRRLWRRWGRRTCAWEYWGAVAMAVLGVSMLLALWPGAFEPVTEALNLGKTPGGALGQRLCGPEHGWMRAILNQTGSAVVACALIVGGLMTIWLYDWQEPARAWWARRRESKREEGEKASIPVREQDLLPGVEEPLADEEQRPERRSRRRRKKAKTPPAESPPEPETLPKPPAPVRSGSGRDKKQYKLPPVDLLDPGEDRETTADPEEVETKKKVLQQTLDSFGIDARVTGATSGPRVTLFEVLPAPGVKVERISQISNNIAMELRAVSLRILTPIPGRKSVGIEVPNASSAIVRLRNLMESPAWKKTKARIPLLLGRNISGKVVILDLADAPHLLIAGATGSGKSVCINTLILSLLYRFSPDELRMIMVDPKVVEFRAYEKLPHLVAPVVSNPKKVPLALRWVIREMERRYRLLARVGARNILGYNSRPASKEPVLDEEGKPVPERLPYIVVIIDELADIMMTAKGDVETSLARIAQLSRAVGIHTIIATQRPSVNVITGTIKANFPTRIAFQVTSQVDSRTILDGKGAESLLGRGDMLFKPPGASKLERNQGALVLDEEIERVVDFWAQQAEQQFDQEVFRTIETGGDVDRGPGSGPEAADADEELVQKAIDIIVRDRRATTSYIQRCLRIGYNRAATIMEILEQRGIVGPQIGTAPREILIAPPQEGGANETENAKEDVLADEEDSS